MSELLGFSLALDLLFNGQNMDYCERPLSLSAMDKFNIIDDIREGAYVAVIAPGGGRLVKNLAERGFRVDAFEGRTECLDHLRSLFNGFPGINVSSMSSLEDPFKRQRMHYDAIFCMDDLRSFRERAGWTEHVHRILKPEGHFIYSQVSNMLPEKKNTLGKYFNLVSSHNVTEDTSKEIRDCYLNLEYWRPTERDRKMAVSALDMVKSASGLRRNIMSGVEVRYVVWQKKSLSESIS